jgi:hypothetical protein
MRSPASLPGDAVPPFTTERWRALSPYLDEALGVTSDRRAGWIAAIGAHDPALAADLSALLAEYDDLKASHFLERLPDWPTPRSID